jgi:hypothetical protein
MVHLEGHLPGGIFPPAWQDRLERGRGGGGLLQTEMCIIGSKVYNGQPARILEGGHLMC